MRLTSLSMKNFAPFADGEVCFPAVENCGELAEVHLLTGENGTGKTRVLAALMASLGNLNELQDRVRQDSGTDLVVGAWSSWMADSFPGTDGDSGELKWAYRNGGAAPGAEIFADQILNRHGDLKAEAEDHGRTPYPPPGEGWAMAGTGATLPGNAKTVAGAEVPPARADEALVLGGPAGGAGIHQRLLNLRTDVAVEKDSPGSAQRLTACLHALEKTITGITGREFALQVGRRRELMVQWGRGEPLYFSELPDGLRSLLNWLAGWVVLQAEHYGESPEPLKMPVVLILDEPENHMHPAWQRRVLPEVQRLFPNAQMFVVTHSPFVVCSLNCGWIHRFVRKADGLVKVEAATPAQEGDTYADAVQDVLGLKAIERFDPESEELLDQFQSLLRKAERGKVPHSELEKKAEKLRKRGGEVASVVETEMYQLAALGAS